MPAWFPVSLFCWWHWAVRFYQIHNSIHSTLTICISNTMQQYNANRIQLPAGELAYVIIKMLAKKKKKSQNPTMPANSHISWKNDINKRYWPWQLPVAKEFNFFLFSKIHFCNSHFCKSMIFMATCFFLGQAMVFYIPYRKYLIFFTKTEQVNFY